MTNTFRILVATLTCAPSILFGQANDSGLGK